MKQPVEKIKKPLWFVEKPEKKIVIKISDIKNSMKKRLQYAPIRIKTKDNSNS